MPRSSEHHKVPLDEVYSKRVVHSARDQANLVQLYNKVLALQLGTVTWPKGSVREITAWLAGVSEKSIQGAVAHARRTDGRLDEDAPERGKPPKLISAELRGLLAEEYRRLLRAGTPTTASHGVKWLAEEHQMEVSAQTVRRSLEEAGFVWGGRTADGVRETKTHVQYRRWFAEKALSLLKQGHRSPKQTMVFLDETYVNQHHTASKILAPKGDRRLAMRSTGPGRRYNIVGAVAVKDNRGSPAAEWVPGCVHWWDSKSEKAKAGKKPKNTHSLEGDSPLDLASSNNPCSTMDYHENFTAALFNEYFNNLCETLATRYGPCAIFMDGAKYHVSRVDPPPPRSGTGKHFAEYLVQHGVAVPEKAKKSELVPLMEQFWARPTRRYSYETASKHGHKLIITPPYQPRANPIEILWGVGKNHVAAVGNKSFSEVSDLLREGLAEKVTQKTMVGAFRKSVQWCEEQVGPQPEVETVEPTRLDAVQDLIDYMKPVE